MHFNKRSLLWSAITGLCAKALALPTEPSDIPQEDVQVLDDLHDDVPIDLVSVSSLGLPPLALNVGSPVPFPRWGLDSPMSGRLPRWGDESPVRDDLPYQHDIDMQMDSPRSVAEVEVRVPQEQKAPSPLSRQDRFFEKHEDACLVFIKSCPAHIEMAYDLQTPEDLTIGSLSKIHEDPVLCAAFKFDSEIVGRIKSFAVNWKVFEQCALTPEQLSGLEQLTVRLNSTSSTDSSSASSASSFASRYDLWVHLRRAYGHVKQLNVVNEHGQGVLHEVVSLEDVNERASKMATVLAHSTVHVGAASVGSVPVMDVL